MNGHDYNCPLTVVSETKPLSNAAFSAVTTDPARCAFCLVANATRWECAQKTSEVVIESIGQMADLELIKSITRACGVNPNDVPKL